MTQVLSKEFYEKITPYAFFPRTCTTIPTSVRDKALFSESDELLTAHAISFIKVLSNDELLVCLNGVESKVYSQKSKDANRPFKKVFNEIATLKEMSGHRISCAAVAEDYFVVSSDHYTIAIFDKASYKCLDRVEIKVYIVTTMCMLSANRFICGHEGSIVTLWDTSREEMSKQQC